MDSTQQQRGGVWICVVIGIVAAVYGFVTGSLGTVAIGIAVAIGSVLLLKLERFTRSWGRLDGERGS